MPIHEYLQRVAAARGAPLTYAIFLDHWLVWCVDEQQARLIELLCGI